MYILQFRWRHRIVQNTIVHSSQPVSYKLKATIADSFCTIRWVNLLIILSKHNVNENITSFSHFIYIYYTFNSKLFQWPESVVYQNGTCLYGKRLYKTAFNISTGLVPLHESCVDTKMRTTIYTKFTLTMDAVGGQTGVKRPSWKDNFLFQ